MSSTNHLVALASTFTAEPLRRSLSFWLNELEIKAEVQFAPYNQIFQELTNPLGLLGTNRNGVNVLLIRPEDWSQRGNPSSASHLEIMKRATSEFISAL